MRQTHSRKPWTDNIFGLAPLSIEYPEKYGWWISELNALGIETDAKNEKSTDMQGLENLTDDVKQNFIRDYKTCYSGDE
jgi:hypothetical protein